MISVLVVEDEIEFVTAITDAIIREESSASVAVAPNGDDAKKLILTEVYDWIILDLKIPLRDGALDTDPRHGIAVLNYVRLEAPGTPVIVLTGSSAEPFIDDLLEGRESIDIWGSGRASTLQFLPKDKLDQFPEKIRRVMVDLCALRDVEVIPTPPALAIDLRDDRLIRIFARRRACVKAQVWRIGGGLSDARVYRIRLSDQTGAPRDDAIGKLDSRFAVAAESEAYDQHITRLPPVVLTQKLGVQDFGAKDRAGIFYQLARQFEWALFDAMEVDPALGSVAVRWLQSNLVAWSDGCGETRATVAEIRRCFMNDDAKDKVAADFGLTWVNGFEQRQVQCRWCSVHGDLHGYNVLANGEGEALIIDYGDVKTGPASIDPVTLELSWLFHSQRQGKSASWPSEDQSKLWANVEQYAGGSRELDFVKACRLWALAVAAGPREVAAVAYGYLLRQLKYEDTDKERALQLLAGCQAYFG